jgi:hypothetical protein
MCWTSPIKKEFEPTREGSIKVTQRRRDRCARGDERLSREEESVEA